MAPECVHLSPGFSVKYYLGVETWSHSGLIFFFFFLARLGGAAFLSALTISRFVMLAAIDGNCLGLLVRFCEMTIHLLKRL